MNAKNVNIGFMPGFLIKDFSIVECFFRITKVSVEGCNPTERALILINDNVEVMHRFNTSLYSTRLEAEEGLVFKARQEAIFHNNQIKLHIEKLEELQEAGII